MKGKLLPESQLLVVHADESCLGNQNEGPNPGGAGALVESLVLLAATRDASRLLEADSLGTIKPGAVADFIVLSADPLADIANTKAIEFIVFKGERYYPEDFGQ